MKKNVFFRFLSVLMIIMVLFAFTSCFEESEHESTAGSSEEQTDALTDNSSSSNAESQTSESVIESLTSESVTDVQTEPVATGYKKVVVFGDSISTGYALTGYTVGTANETIKSYANIVAKDNNLIYGVDYFNFAVDGATTTGVINNINLNSSLLAETDLILITVGGNNIMMPLFETLGEVSGVSITSVDEARLLFNTIMSANEETINSFKQTFSDKKQLIDEEMGKIADDFSKDLVTIFDLIKQKAPNATTVIQTIYNPLDEALFSIPLMQYINESIADVYMGNMNKIIKEKATEYNCVLVDTSALFAGKGATYTNILQFDIHPNEAGHILIGEEIIKATKKN